MSSQTTNHLSPTVVWHSEPSENYEYILSGDIGGTNANLAIVGRLGSEFQIIVEASFPSAGIDSIVPAIRQTLELGEDRIPNLEIAMASISGAGPVSGNCCKLSNLGWDIEGPEIEQALKVPVCVINDFVAISYGVPLLDLADPEQVTCLPHTDGSRPKPTGDIRLIVGAGTGLGVSILMGNGECQRAMPSEGGHASFASFDKETEEIRRFVGDEQDSIVEIEDLLSGRGVATLLDYFLKERQPNMDESLRAIADAALSEKPSLISKYAKNHPVCRDVMRLFVKIYGRVAADLAATVLPRGGLFLGGGIVGKNESHFLGGSQFIYYFEQNSRPQVQEILRQIPVYTIRNYEISLLGAANAGWQMSRLD